ncbi:(2Fe-2S)-binding protein [Bacillus songklensis]|uniref:(2Fe-2S)-binding protein n=1 Tax=Bacillus songklensis TaxID=1069116 RepID=A0ABV8BBE4_9BACI
MKQFSDEELKIFKGNFRLTECSNASPLSIKAVDLTDEQQLKAYLIKVREKVEAANLTVAASLFIKRYSFAVLVALYSMSVLDKRLNFSVENVSVETLDEEDNLWLPSFKLHDLSIEETSRADRLIWRDDVLKQIFCHHVDVLFTHIMKVCKLPKLIMWENLYVYICWMYEQLLNDSQLHSIHKRIRSDFQYILKEGKGHLFGIYHQNPFLKYDQPDQFSEKDGQEVRIRKTCCFAYLTAMKGKHCKTCPVSCGREEAGKS